jgi:hypothetical protein
MRWLHATPDERNAHMKRVRAGQAAKYLERARALPGGDALSEHELAERARQLRLLDLADYRIRADNARRARVNGGAK